jgi:hypothetical protein
MPCQVAGASAKFLERIANAFTKNWIPASVGMTLLLISWSIMPAQVGIQGLGSGKYCFTESDIVSEHNRRQLALAIH